MITQLIAFLDALPDAGRGLLAGIALLALLLLFDFWVSRSPKSGAAPAAGRLQRRRASFRGHRWRIAHNKTSLLALLWVPPLVALLADARMPVYVEMLPPTAAASLSWVNVLVALWLLVALLQVVRLLLQNRAAPAAGEPAPEAMLTRQQHWQRRLGYARPVQLQLGAVAQPQTKAGRSGQLTLPRASAHWPAAATDVALIVPLCDFSLGHQRWLRFAQLMGCLYWPFAFVRQTLVARLRRDFDSAALELAESCYRDPLGFRRAHKQLYDRLGVEPTVALPLSPPERISDAAESAPMTAHRDFAEDPYGRVFLVFAQALLLVYVLIGATLREIPDDSNFPYAEFVHDWYEKIQRSVKYSAEES